MALVLTWREQPLFWARPAKDQLHAWASLLRIPTCLTHMHSFKNGHRCPDLPGSIMHQNAAAIAQHVQHRLQQLVRSLPVSPGMKHPVHPCSHFLEPSPSVVVLAALKT